MADATSEIFPEHWSISDHLLLSQSVTSRIFNVRLRDGRLAIVKQLTDAGLKDEMRGADFLAWRRGAGCVELLSRDHENQLLEYAGKRTLLDHLNDYGDEAATAIMIDVLNRVHTGSSYSPPKELQRLGDRFASLFARANSEPQSKKPSLYVEAARIAENLLANEQDIKPLHGDLHHGNIMLSARGWLAIDPKGLLGDPAYEVANMFYNPLDRNDLRTSENRISDLASMFSQTLGREAVTILEFAFVHACLAASWHAEDGDGQEADRGLDVAKAIKRVLWRYQPS
ncbi:MAG: aminoglycoside phosphotransferase family protein [Phyllobacterium sp.]